MNGSGPPRLPTAEPALAFDSPTDQAIAWSVRLESGEATTSDKARCEAWRAASSTHEEAWQLVQGIEQTFRRLPSTHARHLAHEMLQSAQALKAREMKRRRALKVFGWVTLAGGTGTLAAVWSPPWRTRTAYASAIGARRRVELPDGGSLELNTGCELEVVFLPLRRLIMVKRGEVIITTGPDTDSLLGRRAFWVETPEARMEAIGTRFSVRSDLMPVEGERLTRLHVLEGRVAVHATASPTQAVADKGDTLIVHANQGRIERATDASWDAEAWLDGVLVAKQMRLDALIPELARYQLRPLRCAPSAGGLRVSGVFQLDGPAPVKRALAVLERTLPITVTESPDGSTTIDRR